MKLIKTQDCLRKLAPLYVPIVLSLVAGTFLTACAYDILATALKRVGFRRQALDAR